MGWWIIVIFATCLAVPLWLWICNERTYRQRGKLIDRRPVGPAHWPHSDEYAEVTYDRHLWTLVFLRNPKRLYGPLTQKLWEQRP